MTSFDFEQICAELPGAFWRGLRPSLFPVGLLLLVGMYGGIRNTIPKTLLLVVAVVDLWWSFTGYPVPMKPPIDISLDSRVLRRLSQVQHPARVLGELQNIPMQADLGAILSYGTLHIPTLGSGLGHLRTAVGALGPSEMWDAVAPIANLLGARWIVARSVFERPGLRLKMCDVDPVLDDRLGSTIQADYCLYENTEALPLAFLSASVAEVRDTNELMRRLTSPGHDPRRQTLRIGRGTGSAGQPIPLPAEGRVDIEQWTAHQVRVRVHCTQECWLVLSQRWYPGWTVETEGALISARRLTAADRVYDLFPCLKLPAAGDYTVTFRFRPISFWLGVVCSVITILVVVALWSRRPRGIPATAPPRP